MANYNQKIGAYLAKERKAKKISQTQLAQRLGVSKTAVHYWETGKRTIYADQMIEYCLEICIDPQKLVEAVTEDEEEEDARLS